MVGNLRCQSLILFDPIGCRTAWILIFSSMVRTVREPKRTDAEIRRQQAREEGC